VYVRNTNLNVRIINYSLEPQENRLADFSRCTAKLNINLFASAGENAVPLYNFWKGGKYLKNAALVGGMKEDGSVYKDRKDKTDYIAPVTANKLVCPIGKQCDEESIAYSVAYMSAGASILYSARANVFDANIKDAMNESKAGLGYVDFAKAYIKLMTIQYKESVNGNGNVVKVKRKLCEPTLVKNEKSMVCDIKESENTIKGSFSGLSSTMKSSFKVQGSVLTYIIEPKDEKTIPYIVVGKGLMKTTFYLSKHKIEGTNTYEFTLNENFLENDAFKEFEDINISFKFAPSWLPTWLYI
jgi:hypothetical protein